MIKYALCCIGEHEFEAWFPSSDAYDDQVKAGLVECPVCGSSKVSKQIMAPAVRDSGRKSGRPTTPNSDSMPTPEDIERVASKVREHIAKTHSYVGDKFADTARAMHYGDVETRSVWGEATPEEAKSLADEGVSAVPLPEPFAPPSPKEGKKLN
ncbi:DUF1178 family protein [Hirschia litorea]|uniref:DUF1178 family protein n=1 Tax=Hirschia litorea TaxID=1199156 RepID=A0ABW2IK75_9PROT